MTLIGLEKAPRDNSFFGFDLSSLDSSFSTKKGICQIGNVKPPKVKDFKQGFSDCGKYIFGYRPIFLVRVEEIESANKDSFHIKEKTSEAFWGCSVKFYGKAVKDMIETMLGLKEESDFFFKDKSNKAILVKLSIKSGGIYRELYPVSDLVKAKKILDREIKKCSTLRGF